MLCLEASCLEGKFVEDSEIQEIVKVMFQTMFGGKRQRQDGQLVVDCNGLEVEVPEKLRLSKLGVRERLARVSLPNGKEKAEEICQLFG
jgi:hypothetical protein